MTRRTLSEIRAARPQVDRARLDATTEADIRRHMIEDGQDPDEELRPEDVNPVAWRPARGSRRPAKPG